MTCASFIYAHVWVCVNLVHLKLIITIFFIIPDFRVRLLLMANIAIQGRKTVFQFQAIF